MASMLYSKDFRDVQFRRITFKLSPSIFKVVPHEYNGKTTDEYHHEVIEQGEDKVLVASKSLHDKIQKKRQYANETMLIALERYTDKATGESRQAWKVDLAAADSAPVVPFDNEGNEPPRVKVTAPAVGWKDRLILSWEELDAAMERLGETVKDIAQNN